MLPMNSLALTEQGREEQEIQESVKRLAEQVAEAETNFEKLSADMEQTVKALEESFPAYSELYRETALAVNRLHEQIEQVEREREEARRAAEKARREEILRRMFPDGELPEDDDSDADEADAYDEDEEDDAGPRFRWRDSINRDAARADVRQQGTLKQLFKRLARLTHPDKTDDPVLNKLFDRGREALDEGAKDLIADLLLDAELHIAGNDVDAGKKIPDLMERLMERQRYLNRQLYTWNVRTNSLRQTPMGQVHALTNNDSPTVREQGKTTFKTQLLKRMAELENNAVRLRQQLISAGVTPEA